MLFDSLERFTPTTTSFKGSDIHTVAKSCTPSNIGPGTYYYNGQNMIPNKVAQNSPKRVRSKDDRDSYIGGSLMNEEYLVARQPSYETQPPGPGHYCPEYKTEKEKMCHRNVGVMDSPSKRLEEKDYHNKVLRDGIIVKSKPSSSSDVGPGSYNVESSMIKKSFNRRVSKPSTPRTRYR